MRTITTLLLLSAPAVAQSFNVDIGKGFGCPSNAYGAAAAQPGFWNDVDAAGPTFTPLPVNGLSGALTTVTLEFNDNTPPGFSQDNPLTTGDDEALLDDLDDVGAFSGAKVKYTFAGLQNGTYDVYVYAWAPDDPTGFTSTVEVIGGPAGLQSCGGATWSGAHVLGETYTFDTVAVTTGELKLRVTFGTGSASVNGFQIVQSVGCSSAPVNYCTPGTSASGCQATLSATGTSSATSASGFVLSAANVEGDKDGLFFQGANGQQANGWGNGTSFQCVIPPVKRLGLLGKAGTAGACDGSFSQDLNAYWQAFPSKNPGAGAVVQAQLWYRDPQNTSNQTTSLSEGIEWSVCP